MCKSLLLVTHTLKSQHEDALHCATHSLIINNEYANRNTCSSLAAVSTDPLHPAQTYFACLCMKIFIELKYYSIFTPDSSLRENPQCTTGLKAIKGFDFYSFCIRHFSFICVLLISSRLISFITDAFIYSFIFSCHTRMIA